MSGATRKGVLARGLAVLAGLVGAGAAGRELGQRAGGETLVLRAREQVRPPMRPEQAGDRLLLVAELFGSDGTRAGDLFGAGFALRGPGEPPGPERLELHTFELLEGAIVGTGTVGLREGTFAILGGTGRYAGARGTYLVRRPEPEAASGTDAELVLSLTA
jgi:hypothetical protein